MLDNQGVENSAESALETTRVGTRLQKSIENCSEGRQFGTERMYQKKWAC